MQPNQNDMHRILVAALVLVLSLAVGCSDDDEDGPTIPPDEPKAEPRIELVLDPETAAIGDSGQLIIEVGDLPDAVFGIALRIDFDDTVVRIDEEGGFVFGDLMDADAIAFLRAEGPLLHLAVSNVGDGMKSEGDAVLGSIGFVCWGGGVCDFVIRGEDLVFIDEDGVAVVVEDLVVDGASLVVE